MRKIITALLLALMLVATIGTASAHFTMVFPSDDENMWDVAPEDYIAELGEEKTIYIMWGHPYEHISFDVSSIPEVTITKPDGTTETLTVEETTVEGMDEDGNDGTFVAYKTSFTIDQMGDTVIAVKYEDGEEELIDYTKAVIHCGEEMWVGWDREVGQETEIVPYMRPYGMEEGFVFAGQALHNDEPLADADVEIEIYHDLEEGKMVVEEAEEMYPYDAPMVFTRLTKSNAQGEFSYTLDEPGIWFVGATMEPESGKATRGVFIIPVIEEFPAEDANGNYAELQQEVDEAKQLAQEAKESAESTTESAPGFEGILAIAAIVGAIFLSRRK
jgi:cobalt/nickel transport protein